MRLNLRSCRRLGNSMLLTDVLMLTCSCSLRVYMRVGTVEIILIMHSISPHIIKHFIPLDFSREAIDLHALPRQQKQPEQDNPFHNMKLKNLESSRQRQLVLTFKNKSNSVYRSRKSVRYRQLFQELQEEH